jgi:argininosuccinate lyase
MQEDDKPAATGKAWSGRFGEPIDRLTQRFNASVDFDKRLAEFDIQGSLAHARMLAAVGVIGRADLAAIERGMAQILGEIRGGTFAWSIEREDVHLNIEHRLTELVGEPGKRLHTARSRNDQVATDVRLWVRAEIDTLQELLRKLRSRILDVAEKHAATLMPGFTHLQVAQPVTFGHHLMAYFEMFGRDAGRFADCRRRANRLPLGAGALAGTSYPIDREAVARELGFDGVCENSLDAVSDRDFAIEFVAAAALAMAHVSRLAEELVIWMNPRFGFVDIADRFCTGSSIMPQKKNPDVPELMARQDRARVRRPGRAADRREGPAARLQQGQPGGQGAALRRRRHPPRRPDPPRRAASGGRAASGSHAGGARGRIRDGHRPGRLPGSQGDAVPRRARSRGESGAGGRKRRQGPADLPLARLRAFPPISSGKTCGSRLTPEGSVAARSHIGGTAPAAVLAAIARARAAL